MCHAFTNRLFGHDTEIAENTQDIKIPNSTPGMHDDMSIAV